MASKTRVPQRDQVQMRFESLEQMLPPEHPARAVWAFACSLDLSAWTARIRSRRGDVGAPAIDPRLLVALWLMATLDGIASAREIARLCSEHIAYRWLCGDKPVNYHTIADFRRSDPAALEGLSAQSAAALLHEGLADLACVAQDGVRVRACAGNSSFRRERTLRECLAEAESRVQSLREQADQDGSPPPPSRSQAAQVRAAEDRRGRLEAALANLEELRRANADRRKDKRKEP